MDYGEYAYQTPAASWCRQFERAANAWLAKRGEPTLSMKENIAQQSQADRAKRAERKAKGRHDS